MKIYRLSQENGNMFCRGYCPEFAIALHRLTGYPIYTFNEIETDDVDGDTEEYYLLVHVAVKLPDGRFADVRGIRSEQDIAMNLLASDTTLLSNYKLLPYTEADLYAEQSIEEDAIDMAADFIRKNNDLFREVIGGDRRV